MGGHTRAGLVMLSFALLPATLSAQPRLRLNASLELLESYDDNLFPSGSARVKTSDVVYRLGPRLGLSYTTRTLTARARYYRAGEVFGWRRELNSSRARQEAAFDLGWSPAPRLALQAGALYEDTTMARDLNGMTALETPRVAAGGFSTQASASLRLGSLTHVRAEHAFFRERTSGFPTIETQVASVAVEHRFSDSERATLTLSRRQLGAEGSLTRSDIVTVGWIRQVTPRAHFEFAAGPRVSSDGTVGAEVALGLRGTLPRGDVTFAYLQTEATAAAHLERLAVQAVRVTLRHDISRNVTFRGGPAVYESSDRRSEAIVYRVFADLECRLARRVALTASYVWTHQDGTLAGSIGHNIFALQLTTGSLTGEAAR
jgi:hypothetical protein